MSPDWRFPALAGMAAGLALSPLGEGAGGAAEIAALILCIAGLAGWGIPDRRPIEAAWMALLCLTCAVAGLLVGAARLRALDRDAYAASPGERSTVRGYVLAVPRRSRGTVRVRIDTPHGRVAVEAPEPVPDLPVGFEVRAAGVMSLPPPWLEGNLRLHGVQRLVRAPRIGLTGRRRGGLAGRIDLLRFRAEQALGRGMPDAQAALARGFVLGEDDRIDASTAEDFRRSGLAHLLAVSGQNVVLLALLAAPLLAALGIPLRARLAWLICLIALYVPLAGGGPSIQRAGVMGAAGVVATLAGRRASRIYALLLATTATLALNPRATEDVGWQLSFAAVAGIFLWAATLREVVASHLGSSGWQRGLAEGVAVTVAATLATGPLMAHHFGSLSVTSLPANVLALPAVAPAMWLGMLVAAAGQLPGFPVEPLNAVNSLLLAYISQVARWLGGPSWALATIPGAGWPAVATTYAALAAGGSVLGRFVAGRRGLRARPLPASLGGRRLTIAAVIAVAALTAGTRWPMGGAGDSRDRWAMRVSVLDVGQGDSILLQPADGGALLVDGGPPGSGLLDALHDRGVESLAAAVVTHDQRDHSGGIAELLGAMPVRRLVYASAGRRLIGEATAAGAAPTPLAEGSELRSGSLRLEVLWPPRELLGAPAEDPNLRSLVLLARWRRFEMLLTGDAEAESVPIDPGPIDVLKVSHHGSADSGLAGLLERTAPRLAVISVGEDNPFGHPDPAALATLAAHGVSVLRTDHDGTVTIEIARGEAHVGTAG